MESKINNKELEAFFEQHPISSLLVDQSGGILHMNQAARALIGVTSGQVSDHKLAALLGGAGSPVEQALRTNTGLDAHEVSLTTRSGGHVKMSASVRQFPAGPGVSVVYLEKASGRPDDKELAASQKVSAALKALSNADGSFDLQPSDGEMAASICKVRDMLVTLITNTGILRESIKNGDLSKRLVVSDYPGGLSIVAKEINTVIDSMNHALSISSTAFSKIEKGEVPEKLNNIYSGEYHKIAESLNNTVDGFQAVVESNKVLQRMAQNDHSTGVEGKHVGFYKDIADSTNLIRDRLLHITETVLNISEGDIKDLERYKAIGNGKGKRSDNDHLVPAMIKMMQTVRDLVDQSIILAEAGKSGQLATRVDAAQFNGEFRNVIQGINDTLDSVVVPVNEVMRIAQAYADGDLTARMEIDVQGDFAKLGASMDGIGDSLCALLSEVNKGVELVTTTSEELASAAEEMNASTEQVSTAIQQISKGAQDQAAQVVDTAKTMAELANAASSVKAKSEGAAGSANKASSTANEGKKTIDSTVLKMQEIQKVVGDSAKVIEALGQKSEQIGDIVNVITSISDQTNLLALNAAIEAARAGEQGRGFAVVAEEVKNLAEDSREAAERIAKLIKEVQSETANAVSSMKHGTKSTAEGTAIVEAAGKAFGDIAGITISTANEVTAIATDMISAQQGIEKAAKSVDGIASIAEESASAAEESASSTEELTASMEDMAARAQSLSEMALNLQATSAKFKITEESAYVEPPARPVAKKPTPAQPKRPEVKGTGKVPAKVQESLNKRGIKTN